MIFLVQKGGIMSWSWLPATGRATCPGGQSHVKSVWCMIGDFFLPPLRQYQQEPEPEPETEAPLTDEELRRMKAETFEPENLAGPSSETSLNSTLQGQEMTKSCSHQVCLQNR